MAETPSKRWTPKDVLSMVRELTKTAEQREVLSKQGKYFYNTAISEIVGLLNGSLDPAYFRAEVITATSDITLQMSAQVGGGEIEIILATPNTVQRLTTPWSIGDVIVVSTWDNVGGSPISHWVGKIVSVNDTGLIGTYEMVTGADVDFNYAGGDFAHVTIIHTFSTLSYDLTGLSKPFDVIVEILDSEVGQCVFVKPGEFYSIKRADFAHKSYDDDIIWTQVGNTVYFRNGANITAGTKTVIYQRQPDYPVNYDDTENVDLADKFVPLFAKRIYTYLILQTENDIPKNIAQEMQTDYQQIMAYAGAELANKNKDVKK